MEYHAGAPPLILNLEAEAYPPTSKLEEMEAWPVKDNRLVVALMEKILDILATTPDELAISKKASGVVSPRPNLPRETVENLAKGLPETSLMTRSLPNFQPPEIVSS